MVIFPVITLMYFGFTPAFASAICDTKTFVDTLRSTMFYQGKYNEYHLVRSSHLQDEMMFRARSTWAESPQVKKWNSSYPWIKFKHSNPITIIQEGSLAEKSPRLTEVLDDVNFFSMSQQEFERQFLSVRGKYPSFDDISRFYLNRLEMFQDGGWEYLSQLKKLDPVLYEQMAPKFGDEMKELYDQFVRALKAKGVGFEEVTSATKAMTTRMKSILSELYVASSLKNVKAVGSKLSENSLVLSRLDSRIAELKKIAHNDQEWTKLEERFPRVFGNGLSKNRNSTRTAYLDNLGKWLKSKEIDVIRKEGGKEVWVEIKRKAKRITLDDFTHGSEAPKRSFIILGDVIEIPAKTMQTQIEEDQQILKLLGLENDVLLEYHSVSGVDPAVAGKLRDMHVKVIPSVYD